MTKGKRKVNQSQNEVDNRQPQQPRMDPESETNNGEKSNVEEELIFEDPFEDEFEDEEFFDDEGQVDNENKGEDENKGEGEEDDNDDVGNEEMQIGEIIDDEKQEERPRPKIFRPGVDQLENGEDLEYDPKAYLMYHSLRSEWPCLSFDIIRDSLGEHRTRFPMTSYIVSGSQADRPEKNKLTVMKMSDLSRTEQDSDSDDSKSDDDDDDFEDDPTIDHVNISHHGGVNRVRSMPQHPNIVTTWAENAKVHVWDISPQLATLDHKPGSRNLKTQALFTFHGHSTEGYAMCWSPCQEGRLATGDNDGNIYIWNPQEGGTWNVDPTPFHGHSNSVEDIQWSHTEPTVFISCSSDQTICVWDTRSRSGPMLKVHAHDSDVNVISWNKVVNNLLVSGSDDGSFKIWDLRTFDRSEPAACFKWHRSSISSVEWHPTDESVVAVAGADDQLTIWDLSVEDDDKELQIPEEIGDLPPQLLFVHQGQKEIKELHFHPQAPGVIISTALDGFNIFKPSINM